MRTLPKPTENSGDVFDTCIDMVSNTNLKVRLKATKLLIENAASEFDGKVTTGELHHIIREVIVNGNVSSKELADVYTFRMAKLGTAGRQIYDKLKIAPKNGVCPLCSQRLVTTLDHHLPKTQYPRLSVVPFNLVPACSDCNKSKLTKYPTCSEEEMFHPYYDNIDNDLWLNALIRPMTPPTILFYVNPSANWNTLLTGRINYHFNSLELNKLYSTHAAVELTQINQTLQSLFNNSGSSGVKNYLLEGYESRRYPNQNSWQAAMYKAMADDEWFCNGGFIM